MNDVSSVKTAEGGGGYFERKFFASSNSADGFHNDYSYCFGEESGVAHLYIIKGGPGTGKSHFMRTIARYAESKGYDTTYYYCSSDPASLDGIRLEKAGKPCLGFVDGTPPHIWEPTYPGVKEEIINLGSFWDATALRRADDQIFALNQGKKACYDRAYRYLKACGQTSKAAGDLLSPCILDQKLSALASRLVRGQGGDEFEVTPAHLGAVGMTGSVYFNTYAQMAEKARGEVVYIHDYYGTGYTLMKKVYGLAEKRRCKILVSRDPVHTNKIDGIFFSDTSFCLLVSDAADGPPTCRDISLRRYVDSIMLKERRGEIRHALGLTKTLKEGAVRSLIEAGKYHFALEKIYASAMDFSAKENYTQSLCKRYFG